jgi:hypothetical protein
MASDCDKHRGLLEELHDSELPDELRGSVEAHVSSCPDCSRDLERIRRLERLLADAEAPVRVRVDEQVVRIRERIARNRVGTLRIWGMAAAAAALAAIGVVWMMRPTVPVEEQVARLVREYLDARNGRGDQLATRISAFGGQAVPVVCRMIHEADPSEQVKLSKVIARFGEGERRLILQYLGSPEGGGEIVLTAQGWDAESDREVALRLAQMLVEETAGEADPRLKRMAERAVEEVVRWGDTRHADEELRRTFLGWLRSDNPELVRRAADLADSAQLTFTDDEVIDLLSAPNPNVRRGAHKYLKARFGEDRGEDPESWRR